MEEVRQCIACGVKLAGPFRPEITLTLAPSDGPAAGEPLKVMARAWICPGCGLVQWHARDQDLDPLLAVASSEEGSAATPGTGYERRSQMLRMLRRVRRM